MGLTRTIQRGVDRFTARWWSSPVRPFGEVVRVQRDGYARAQTVVRAFYVMSVVWAVQTMPAWEGHLDAEGARPFWPAFWLNSVDHRTGVTVILYGHLLSALLAAGLPTWRVARLAYFVSYLTFLAFVNGYGKIFGHYTGWLYVAFFLVFLPSARRIGPGSVTSRHRYLTAFWNAQVALMVMYTLTGLWKVFYAIWDLQPGGRMSTLKPDGFPLILAHRALETNESPLLADLLIGMPFLGWALYLGTMYLETGSVLVALRPRLHRLWGLGLIAFHVGTQLTMDFTFVPNIALLGLVFVCSPAAPERIDVRATLLDLPVVRITHRAITRWRGRSRGSAPAPDAAPAA